MNILDNNDPKVKATKEYGLAKVQEMWNSYTKQGGNVGFNARHLHDELISIAQGGQNLGPIKQLLRYNNHKLEKEGYNYIDFQVLNLATKFINLIKGKINKIDYNIDITPIDPVSLDHQKQYEKEAKAFIALKGWLDGIGANSKALFSNIDVAKIPDEPDDLMIDMQMNYKLQQAMEDELDLIKIFEKNSWDNIRSHMAFDLPVLGIAAVKAFLDSNGNEKVQWISNDRLVVSHSELEDFSDIEYAGHIDYISVAEFRKETAYEYTEAEQDDIIKKHASSGPLTQYDYSVDDTLQDGIQRLAVLRFQYLTDHIEKYVIKKNKRGNQDISEKKYNFQPLPYEEPLYKKGEKELVTNAYTAKYGGSWVIGTDVIYEYKLQPMPRSYSNYCDTPLDYIIHAPNMRKGRITPLLAQILEPLLMINVAWNKMKDILAKGHTGFLNIKLAQIADVALGKGGAKWEPKDVLDLLYQNNIMVDGSLPNQYNQNQGSAIEWINSGITITDYINTISMCIDQIRQITGINENSDGSTPKTNTLNGVMEMANESTNTVLDYLYTAYHSLYQRLAKSLLLLKHAKSEEGVPIYEFVIGLNKRPSEEELNVLRAELQKNVAIPLIEGGLTSADVIEIYHAGKSNMKLAEQLMISRVRKNQRTAQAQKERDMQLAMEQSQMAAQQAAQATQAQIQAELQADIARIQAEHMAKMEQIALTNSGATRLKEIANQGALQVAKQSGADRVITEAQRSQSERTKAEIKANADLLKEISKEDQSEKDREHDKEQREKDRSVTPTSK